MAREQVIPTGTAWACRDHGGPISHRAVASQVVSRRGRDMLLVHHRREDATDKHGPRDFFRVHDPDGRVCDVDHPDDLVQALGPGDAPRSSMIAEALASIPEIPDERLARLLGAGVPEKAARALVADKPLGDYLDQVAAAGAPPPAAANWVLGEPRDALPGPDALAAVVAMVERGELTRSIARERVLPACLAGADPAAFVDEHGLRATSEGLDQAIDQALADPGCAGLIDDYRAGKKAVLNAILGRCMRATGSRADPRALRAILEGKLGT